MLKWFGHCGSSSVLEPVTSRGGVLLEAVPAIDGLALGRLEGHFALLFAVSASGLVELPGGSIPVKRHLFSSPFLIRSISVFYAQLNLCLVLRDMTRL